MIDGERYKRTANQLGCKEATKEGTAKAWMEYVENVEASLKPAPSIKQLRVASIQKTLTQAPPEETDELKQAIINIESGEYDPRLALVDEPTIWRNINLLRKAGINVSWNPEVENPEEFGKALSTVLGQARIHAERKRSQKFVESNKTIISAIDRFLEEVKLSVRKQCTYAEIAAFFNIFKTEKPELVGKATEDLNEDFVSAHWIWLKSKDYEANGHNKRLGFFRRFVEWCRVHRLIPSAPLNIKLKHHRKQEEASEIEVFKGSMKKVLADLPEKQRLWALLGLNCSMTATDLGQLRWTQIEKGWLTRKRVKTAMKKKTPVVRYKLWPETLELLNKMPKDNDLVFHVKGKPYYTETKNLFDLQWKRMSVPCPITLGRFRHEGATALKAKKEFREFVDLHLGHAGKLSDKVYSAEEWEQFSHATDFIRQHLLR